MPFEMPSLNSAVLVMLFSVLIVTIILIYLDSTLSDFDVFEQAKKEYGESTDDSLETLALIEICEEMLNLMPQHRGPLQERYDRAAAAATAKTPEATKVFLRAVELYRRNIDA